MKKVAIVGCGGSGKSHVARALGDVLDAPVTHLDAAFYDDEWNELSMEKFAAVQRDLVAREKWVIDGNYNSTLQIRLQACDTVVLMDVSTLAALWGVFPATPARRRAQGQRGAQPHPLGRDQVRGDVPAQDASPCHGQDRSVRDRACRRGAADQPTADAALVAEGRRPAELSRPRLQRGCGA